MPIRSSQAAQKAMNDGDFVETSHRSLDGDTITYCPSTRAHRGDASTVGQQQQHRVSNSLPNNTNNDNTIAEKSTRTHRHHLVDGKPLLKRQAAAVWNRPSMAKPQMLAYRDQNSFSTVSSLSLNSLESFSSYSDIMAGLEEEYESDETSTSIVARLHQEEKGHQHDMADMNDTSNESQSIVKESRRTDEKREK